MKIKMTVWVKVKNKYLGEATYYIEDSGKGMHPLLNS